MEKFPTQRSNIIARLLEMFGQIRNGRVLRGALWIIGEYTGDLESMTLALEEIRKSLGEIPLLESEQAFKELNSNTEEVSSPLAVSQEKKRVLADGTYATESAFLHSTSNNSPTIGNQKPNLRSLLLGGDYFLGSVLATTLVKIAFRFADISSDALKVHSIKSEAMLIMTSIIRVGKSEYANASIDEDSLDRILLCLRALSIHDETAKAVFLKQCRDAFTVIASETEVFYSFFNIYLVV